MTQIVLLCRNVSANEQGTIYNKCSLFLSESEKSMKEFSFVWDM